MAAMGLGRIAVQKRCQKIYKKEAVRGRKGLLEKYAKLYDSTEAAVGCGSPHLTPRR